MVWAIIFGILVVLIFNLVSNNKKDSETLAGTSIEEKFSIIINRIIEEGFDGNAVVKKGQVKGQLVIYNPQGINHFVEIMYSYGNLQIKWKYKFYQKEMIYNRTFLNIRNLSSFEEIKIADILIQEVIIKIQNHKSNVMREL